MSSTAWSISSILSACFRVRGYSSESCHQKSMPNALTSQNHIEPIDIGQFFNDGLGLPLLAQFESDNGKPGVITFVDDSAP
jgi:hypothetical protein